MSNFVKKDYVVKKVVLQREFNVIDEELNEIINSGGYTQEEIDDFIDMLINNEDNYCSKVTITNNIVTYCKDEE